MKKDGGGGGKKKVEKKEKENTERYGVPLCCLVIAGRGGEQGRGGRKVYEMNLSLSRAWS